MVFTSYRLTTIVPGYNGWYMSYWSVTMFCAELRKEFGPYKTAQEACALISTPEKCVPGTYERMRNVSRT